MQVVGYNELMSPMCTPDDRSVSVDQSPKHKHKVLKYMEAQESLLGRLEKLKKKRVEHLTTIVECNSTKKVPCVDFPTPIHIPLVEKVPVLLQISDTNAPTVKRSTEIAESRLDADC